MSEIFFQHEKRNFVSPSGHVIFYLLHKHQWTTKPFHFNSLLRSHSNGDIFTCEDNLLFFSKLASGRNPPNPAIWLVPRAGGILRSCPLTRAESLAASFTSLFVVVNEQNRWFRTIFLLKLALLLALAREKWILLFRQNIWRENQASQPGKPLK